MDDNEAIDSYVRSVALRDNIVDGAPTGGLTFLGYLLAIAVAFNAFGLAVLHPILTKVLIIAAVGLLHLEIVRWQRVLAASRIAGVERVCAIMKANPGLTIPVGPPRGYFNDDQWHA